MSKKHLKKRCSRCNGKGKIILKNAKSSYYFGPETVDCPICLGRGKV